MLENPYHIAVIDIGSPKLGNLGWSFIDIHTGQESHGADLDDLIPLISKHITTNALILGFDAPLFVPIRNDLMLSTKARKGEGRRPWSAGAGAQTLTMNLPIMVYLLSRIKQQVPHSTFIINQDEFSGQTAQILLFEALISGADKGSSHVHDAQIMAQYCLNFSQQKMLPPTILEQEKDTQFFNLAAAALLQCKCIETIETLSESSPIYKPS